MKRLAAKSIFLFAAIIIGGFGVTGIVHAAWLSGYAYRAKIPASHTDAGAQTDYTKQITIVQGSGDNTAGTIYLNSHALNWPNDIRFTRSDGTTPLDFYREESDATDGTWDVELNSIAGTGDTDFYVYYGKSSDTDASSGVDTFIFFDDFEAGNLDLWTSHGSSWSDQSTTKFEGSYAAKGTASDSNQFIYKDFDSPLTSFAVQFKYRTTDATEHCIFGALQEIHTYGYTHPFVINEVSKATYYTGTDWTTLPVDKTFSADAWYTVNYAIDMVSDPPQFRWLYVKDGDAGNANLKNEGNTVSPHEDRIWGEVASAGGGDGYIDQVMVRNYAYPEPQWATPGSEEPHFTQTIDYQGKLADGSGSAVADGPYDIVFKLYDAAGGGNTLWTESWTNAALFTDTNIDFTDDGCDAVNHIDKVAYTNVATESTLAAGQYLTNIDAKESAVIQSVNTDSDYICIYDVPSGAWDDTEDVTNRIYVKNGLFSVMIGSVTPLSAADFNQTLYLGVKVGTDDEMTPRKKIGAVPAAFEAKQLEGKTWAAPGTIGLTTSNTGVFRTLAATIGSIATPVLTVTQSGTGNITGLLGDSITTGTGLAVSTDGLVTGTAVDISSTSAAGGASGISKLLNLARSGTNSNSSHTAYGLYSSVTNTGDASANVAGYFTASGATNNYAAIFAGGDVGVGTVAPSNLLDLQKAGTAAATTDLLELTNSGNAASMADTGTGILFNQWYYDASTPAVADAGRIAALTEGNWTSAGSSQDAYLAFSVALDGTVTERMRITSAGTVGIGITAPDTDYALDVNGSAKGAYWKPFRALAERTGGGFVAMNYYDSAAGRAQFMGDGGTVDPGIGPLHGNVSDNILRIGDVSDGYGSWDATQSNIQLVTGRIGIGTTSPGQRLTVQGTIGILESAGAAYHTIFTGGDQSGDITYTLPAALPSSNATLYCNTSGALFWIPSSGAIYQDDSLVSVTDSGDGYLSAIEDGSEILRVTGSRLGIGTIAPSNILDLERSGAVTQTTDLLELTNSGNAASMTDTGTGILFNQWYYDASTPAVADAGRIAALTEGNWTSAGSSQDAYLAFSVALNGTVTERMRITSAGYVGIDTTTPGSELDVKGALHISGVTSGYLGLVSAAAAGSTTYTLPNVTSSGGAFVTDGSGILSLGSSGGSVISAGDSKVLVFDPGDGYMIFTEDGGEKMRVDSVAGGLMGIGTTSPSSFLDLQKAGTVKTNTDLLEITNSGNAADMDATASGILFNQWYYNMFGSAVADAGRIAVVTETDWTSDAATQDSYLALSVALGGTVTERMRITSAGYVGIGATTPVAKLYVVGPSIATVATFDRKTSDGTLVSFARDGAEKGSISVSGSSVYYNGFTGSHYAWPEEPLEPGTLVSLTGNNHRLHDDAGSEIIYGAKKTSQANDPKVLGVALGMLEPSKPLSVDNPYLVASVGNVNAWVVDAGRGDVEAGNYLVASPVVGNLEKEDSANPANNIIARALEPIRWSGIPSMTPDGIKRAKISVSLEFNGSQNQFALDDQGLLAGGPSDVLAPNVDSEPLKIVKSVLKSLGIVIENGIANLKEMVVDEITLKEIETIDPDSGDIYCAWVENGGWKTARGSCADNANDAADNSTPPIGETAATGDVPDPDGGSEPRPGSGTPDDHSPGASLSEILLDTGSGPATTTAAGLP